MRQAQEKNKETSKSKSYANSSQARSQRSGGSGGRMAAEIIISLALIGIVGYTCYHVYQAMTPISQEISDLSLTVQSETETSEDSIEETTVYENIAVDNAQVYAGDLILINSDYAYTANNEDEITSIYSYKTENNVTVYSVSGAETSLRLEAIEALTDLLTDFYVAIGRDDIIIQSGYRTYEEQQALYDADLEATDSDTSELVAIPGHSEHESGYSVDLSIYNEDGTISDYDGSGDYEWIDNNCSHYGYILRYAADKTDVTGIQSEEWHYRYVGQPHATYIMENNLCLEEYITLLKSYTSDNHLKITNWDGEIYEVYYVPADTSADNTYVLIPSEQDYTISGNNVDGFIITVDTGEIQTYEATAEESSSTATDTESSAAEENVAAE